MKREAELKAQWVAEMKRTLPGFIILQYATAGAPDREVVGMGITTRYEFKHATPCFDSPGGQELTCMRLAAAGHCRYVIWAETSIGIGQRTIIAHPKAVHGQFGIARNVVPEASCEGFDMRWLVEQVRIAHRIGG